MPQDIINLAISAVGVVFGWIMRIVWQAQTDQRRETSDLANKVNKIEVLVAGQYVRRDELAGIMQRIDVKLDAISVKLDGKQDRRNEN